MSRCDRNNRRDEKPKRQLKPSDRCRQLAAELGYDDVDEDDHQRAIDLLELQRGDVLSE